MSHNRGKSLRGTGQYAMKGKIRHKSHNSKRAMRKGKRG